MNPGKALEDVYQKKNPIEHILLRPDSYVGSIEKSDATLWIKPENSEFFELKKIEYVPGFYKIFDEIIVNAADNFQRDNTTTTIKVSINRKTNEISVYNNGEGIPVHIHKTYKVYIPEMIFGELLSGSNFNDEERKVTGGRNGYGAKLTNIFSTKFTIETADAKSRKKFKMTWTNNMSNKSEPEICEWTKESFTKVTFKPDLARFGMKTFDDDTFELFSKRVYDLAGVINEKVKVYFNDEKIDIKGFKSYVDMYLKPHKNKKEDEEEFVKLHLKENRWEVVLVISDDQFQQVSFVNSICTSKGGTHVGLIMDQIVDALSEAVKKVNKKIEIKPAQIKNNFMVFVNCLIENPAFDSQTKETLTTKPAKFGSTCQLSDKFIKQLLKVGIVDQILLQAEMRENAKMKKALQGKKRSKLLGIQKLEDANMAGTKDSDKCLLILTEGDSAKSLAMAGMEIVGRDYFGVFPLKGKLLNVREAPKTQITNNEEIQHLIEIIGLQVGKTYDDVKTLRYGGIMIMTDQDVDGSHIKGLIINFISHFWPSLMQRNGFLKEFITPILKVTKSNQTISFYTVNDYKRWASTIDMKGWKAKYYKGLGTSTDKEAREYFSEIEKHRIEFIYQDREDEEKIDLLFNKKKADMRKDWLTTFDENNVLDHKITRVRYKDFIDKEMIHFSVYDNMRSIPSLVDGFKPGQRKIIYGCFKKNLTSEIKVAQLSGYIAEHSAYHHGENSLQMTIVNLAQNYVGSNNINLLEPIGQFGTRAIGGKDAASARYIHTCLSKIARFLFNKHDDEILTYVNDDGQFVEPTFYVPVIPMVLVNGAQGIGTGWSTDIPCFSPHDIVDNLLRKLDGHEFVPMNPFYKGFTGEIIKEYRQYVIKGIYSTRIDEDVLEITELPIGKWTRPYKTFLETMISENPVIDDFREYHTTQNVHFEIKMKENMLPKLIQNNEIEKKFKLSTTISMNNFVLFDRNGIIRRYESEIDILQEFYNIRLEFYQKRKEYLISNFLRDIAILENKERFILYVIDEKIKIRNIKKKEVVKQLVALKFRMMKDMPRIKSFMEENKILSVDAINAQQQQQENENDVENTNASDDETETKIKEYNYLINLPIWSLSFEQVEKLKKEVQDKKDELDKLYNYTEKNMWKDDLLAFVKKLEEMEAAEILARKKEDEKLQKMGKGGQKRRPMKAAKKKEKTISETVSMTETIKSDDSRVFKEEKQPKVIAKPNVKRAGGGNNTTKPSNQSNSSTSNDKNKDAKFIEDLKNKDIGVLSLADRIRLMQKEKSMNPTNIPKESNMMTENNETKRESGIQSNRKKLLYIDEENED